MEKIFAEGFSFKRNEKAPDFVIGRLSLKADEAIEFIKKHQKNGWINLDVKKARTGNFYIELDTYEPNGGESRSGGQKTGKNAKYTSKPKQEEPEDDGDLPF